MKDPIVSRSIVNLAEEMNQNHIPGLTHIVLASINEAAANENDHTSRLVVGMADVEIDGRFFTPRIAVETVEIEPPEEFKRTPVGTKADSKPEETDE